MIVELFVRLIAPNTQNGPQMRYDIRQMASYKQGIKRLAGKCSRRSCSQFDFLTATKIDAFLVSGFIMENPDVQ